MKSLSKSQYTRGLQCAKSLWLYRNAKDLASKADAFQESIMDAGTEFGVLAQKWMPGGVLIKAGHEDPEAALRETADAIAAGATAIYEGAFLWDDVLVRADIIAKSTYGNWSLFEVKSGTKVAEEHIPDVAIQRYVLAGAGLNVSKTFLVHANPGYVRKGDLNLQALFMAEEVTAESADALAAVPAELARMKAYADGPEAPAKEIGDYCNKPHPCEFKAHCWAGIPEYSVFNIPYMKMERKLELFNRGVQLVHQVDPLTEKITDKRMLGPIQAARLGKPSIDHVAIVKFLAGISYPIAHLDFETEAPVVPPYDGLRPYSQMPFQASVRVQKKIGAPIVEHGFLGDGTKDPREALAKFLVDVIPETGSVLAYYKVFEGGRLKELAAFLAGALADPLLSMEQRLVDLADPFSKGWFTDPNFKGRWSIKAVLPALCPDMTYKNLMIQDGTAAMAAYAELRDQATTPERRAALTEGLKAYCAQDTEAMCKILDRLYTVAA